MSCKEKCGKCNKVVKDGVACSICENLMHTKCAGLTDELFHVFSSVKNLKWFCDNCLKFADGFKCLTKTVDDNHKELTDEVKRIVEYNAVISNELGDLKKLIVDRDEKASQSVSADGILDRTIADFKTEMNVTWASIVGQEIKKNIEGVSVGVKSEIQRTLSSVDEMKDKENNVVMFNLEESDRSGADKEKVIALLKDITGNAINEDSVIKVFRQGKKGLDMKHARPVIVKFDSLITKSLVLSRSFKINSLDGDLNKVRISHDLTRELRSEYNILLAEARSKEAADDGHFLYRVRGAVGRWKVIRFLKKTV